ncbi:hypothetical protein pv_241 [Pithovirus sibericum]|uniref:Uncharacterized protein n=1 Tax=Pithovirus sibericum TaxID=1450746 RepID=W5S4W6_9VIRU|nr:hypothetical protein pv_241 [Pithovirus sibericum]AHH01808.1 hypothetical protein pv_241 [Pithovirus sibericum]
MLNTPNKLAQKKLTQTYLFLKSRNKCQTERQWLKERIHVQLFKFSTRNRFLCWGKSKEF